MHRYAWNVIVIGEKESFDDPIPGTFIPERAGIGAGATIIAPLARIRYTEYLSISVVHFGGIAANFNLTLKTLISSNGLDQATGGFINPVLSDPITVALTETSTRFHDSIDVPLTEALEISLENIDGAIIATAPLPSDHLSGAGIQVRVHGWS